MTQKILINTTATDFVISRSTYTRLMKQHGWQFIGLFQTKEEADAEIARLKGLDETPDPVTITTKYSGNGVITPMTDGSPEMGGDYTYQFTPNSGNKVYTVIIDGRDCGPIPAYTFKSLTRNHTLTVVFSPITSPSAGNVFASIFATAGGYVSKKGEVQIPTGQAYTFTAQPYPDYRFEKIIINDVEHALDEIPQGSMLFEEVIPSVSEPVTIQVYFTLQVPEVVPALPVTKYVWETLYGVWSSNITARDDPDIIAATEYLISTNPNLINGGGSTLKLVTIPDGVDWEIKKLCNGAEVIASKFEVWK